MGIRIYQKPEGTPASNDLFIFESKQSGVYYDKKVKWTTLMGLISAINDLQYYYKKSETYTKTEVNQLIAAIPTFSIEVVQQLPTTDISTTTIYLVPKQDAGTLDYYDEYINLDGTTSGWEWLGKTQVDLSDYYTKSETRAYVQGTGGAYVIETKNDFVGLTTTAQTVIGALNEIKQTADGAASAATSAGQTATAAQGTADAAANAAAAAQLTANGKSTVSVTESQATGDTLATITVDNTPYVVRQKPADAALDSTSTNAVQNGVVTDALATKAEQDGTYSTLTSGKAQTVQVPVPSSVGTKSNPYIRRQIPYNTAEAETMQIVGATVNANQLVDTNTTSVTIPPGHKYIAKISGVWSIGESDGTAITVDGSNGDMVSDLTAWFGSTTIPDYAYTLEQSESGSGIAWLKENGFFNEDYIGYRANGLASVNVSEKINVGKNLFSMKIADIKALNTSQSWVGNTYSMYGVTFTLISDDEVNVKRIDASGNSSGGAPLLYLGSYYGGRYRINGCNDGGDNKWSIRIGYGDDDTFLDRQMLGNDYVYDRPDKVSLRIAIYPNLSINTSFYPMIRFAAVESNTYEPYHAETITLDSSKTLRGLYGLDENNNIVADGDTYNADGSVGVNYEERAYQSGDESLPDAITDGTTTVIKLTTPTTDTAAPFTANQTVDGAGTEELTDYGVESGSRDFAVPPGNNSNYYAYTDGSMTIPAIPPADGDYEMKLHISGGVKTFTWE